MSEPVPADGFCPSCGALADEACHNGREPIPDHKRRHPMPTAAPVSESQQ